MTDAWTLRERMGLDGPVVIRPATDDELDPPADDPPADDDVPVAP